MNKIETDKTDNRRPIKSRQSAWAKATAAWLAKNNVSPNFISLLSIAFALIAFFSFWLDVELKSYHILFMILVIIGIVSRLIMNLLDGMVAVEYGKKSIAGGLFNEVPDRISDTIIIVGSGLEIKNLSFGMDIAYIAAILAIMTAYIRTLGASMNCGHTFIGPTAKQQRMALIAAGCVIAIWYVPIFYYFLIIMIAGLLVTCYRRLDFIYKKLKTINT